MQVNRKTRNIIKYLSHINQSDSFLIGIDLDTVAVERLQALGFDSPLVPGQRLLPSAATGPACRRNAEGYEIIHRDQPMETAFRQVEWHWTQFRGRYESEEMSRVVDVSYKRYPRTFVRPYGIELEVRVRADGRSFVISGPFEKTADQLVAATNTANVLREALGGFEVMPLDLNGWVSAPIRRLNWQLLPPGKNPWESAQPVLERMLQRAPAGNQNVLRARLEAVGSKGPDFVAIGMGGFDGYTVFGFNDRKLCVLECPHVNNATYILPLESWESISRMTKAEILNAKLHKVRIVHTRSWFDALDAALSSGAQAA